MTTTSMLPDPLAERLARSGVVAVVTVENPEDAGPIARALLTGGVGAIELTFRTARAAEAIRRIRAEVPEILAGAGTLLNRAHVEAAIEVGADLLVKGTKVDGIYSADPVLDPSAVRYARLTYDRVLDERLNVMDATAIVMCRDNGLPLKVFNLFNAGDLLRIARGEDVGTIVTN